MAAGGTAGRLGPTGGVTGDPVAELAVLVAAGRQDRDKPPIGVVDMVHVRPAGQLAVGDVEEVGAPEHGGQPVPGVDVGGVVDGVAVGDAAADGDRAVGGHGQHPYQLFEVGPVVLVVPVGDRRRRFAATGSADRLGVGAREGNRGRVVVQLRGVEAEPVDRAQRQAGQQAGVVGVEQPGKRPADAVVV